MAKDLDEEFEVEAMVTADTEIMATVTVGQIQELIQDNDIAPEDLFDEDSLSDWARRHEYVRQD